MKIRITTKHLYVASLLITATSLAIGVNQPVNGAPVGSDNKPIIAKSTNKPKFRPQAAAPEAGVQLLMGILHKIGNEPLVAYQKNQSRGDEGANKSSFLANAANGVDPAFVIRPQQQQQQQMVMRREKGKQAPQSEQLLAMLPKKQAELQRAAAVLDKDSRGGLGDDGAMSSANMAANSVGAPSGSGNFRQNKVINERPPGLGPSINKLYSITKFVEEITAGKSIPAADQGLASEDSFSDSESRVIRTGSRSLGNRISSAPRIDEFSGGKTTSYGSGYISDAKRSGIMETDDFKARERESSTTSTEKSEGGVTYMKPDSPASYKSLKEYGAPPTPEPLAELKKSKPVSIAYGGAGGVSVAYIPPQLVAGIPGLRLGVPETAVDQYVKGKGIVHRQQVSGWKVTSVTSNTTGKTALQIYMRHGTVQAFRVFDPAFVPDGLGVSLHGKLSSMKKKFGQQQFILDEPSNDGEGNGARNYVYPVNQISFQLARSNPKDQPTVQSLLLFQFL